MQLTETLHSQCTCSYHVRHVRCRFIQQVLVKISATCSHIAPLHTVWDAISIICECFLTCKRLISVDRLWLQLSMTLCENGSHKNALQDFVSSAAIVCYGLCMAHPVDAWPRQLSSSKLKSHLNAFSRPVLYFNVTAGLRRTAPIGVPRLASSPQLFCLPQSMCMSATEGPEQLWQLLQHDYIHAHAKKWPKYNMLHLSNTVRHAVQQNVHSKREYWDWEFHVWWQGVACALWRQTLTRPLRVRDSCCLPT